MKGLFGKKGIVGVANKTLTAEVAFCAGQASAVAFSASGRIPPRILIGRDTRASGDMLEAALSSGVCSVGVQVVEAGVIPAPALAYLVVKYKMDGGIMIGASDEPMEYNGISFFDSKGLKISGDTQKTIEALATREKDISPYLKSGKEIGRITCTHTALRDYVDYAKKFAGIDFCGMKIAIDCANGAAFQCAKLIFKELGADVEMINNVPDGTNINADCGTEYPGKLMDFVASHRCNFGFVIGGNAEKVIVVDEMGRIIENKIIEKILSEPEYGTADGLILAVKLTAAFGKSGVKDMSDFVGGFEI